MEGEKREGFPSTSKGDSEVQEVGKTLSVEDIPNANLSERSASEHEASKSLTSQDPHTDFGRDSFALETGDILETQEPEFWTSSISQIRTEMDSQIFDAFVNPLSFQKFDPETKLVEVVAPSRLIANHVDDNFKPRLEQLMKEYSGGDAACLQLRVGPAKISPGFSKDSELLKAAEQIAEQAAGEAISPRKIFKSAYTETIDTKRGGQYVVVKKLRPKQEGASSTMGSRMGNGIRGGNQGGVSPVDRFSSDAPNNINTKYTFSNFVVGSSNQFCHAAAMHVAEQPGTDYNPLFIYGGVGLGKTHLMHAIGNAVVQHKPGAKVLYMSSETFTNELIQSLRFAKMDEFKNRLRNIDLLLIDDIQFMCGKERTQEEFFHTFNALYNAKSQIVITSDKVPQEIPGIEERLKTRFSWGLTADLQAPDFETRVAIVRRKATIESVALPEKVAHLIAEKISSNVRELEGALTRLHAIASLQGVPITIDMAHDALKPLIQKKKVHVTVDDIKRSVADYFSIKVSEMVSKRRTKNLSYPRHIAMYLCRKHTTCSYPEIGGHFGGRDHSSVIHAANVVNTKLRSSAELQGHVREIESDLLNS